MYLMLYWIYDTQQTNYEVQNDTQQKTKRLYHL